MSTPTEGNDGPFLEGAEPSEEAVFETANALLRMHEDGQDKDIRCPDEIPGRLHYHGYLRQKPHYQVVLAAMTEAGIGHMLWGHVRTGEDLLRKYVYEERIREVRRRREISARRQRDFEERGLSAEESDRFARYLSSVGTGQGHFITLILPDDWEPPRITKEEAEEIYWEFRRKQNANYLRDLEEWRQSSPKDKRRYPEPRPPVDDDRVGTLKMLLYWREEERREEKRKERRQEKRQRLESIRSPEDLRAYEQEFAPGALSP